MPHTSTPTSTQWQQAWHTVGAPAGVNNLLPSPWSCGPGCNPPDCREATRAPRADRPSTPTHPRRRPQPKTFNGRGSNRAPPEFPGCIRLLGAQTRRPVGVHCGGSQPEPRADPGNAGGDHEQRSESGAAGSGLKGRDRFREECRGKLVTPDLSHRPPAPAPAESTGPPAALRPGALRAGAAGHGSHGDGGASTPEAPPPAG